LFCDLHVFDVLVTFSRPIFMLTMGSARSPKISLKMLLSNFLQDILMPDYVQSTEDIDVEISTFQ